MGCNCKRENQKVASAKRSEELLSGSIKTVELPILKTRRDTCRTCDHCTKNPNPKFQKFGGLTNLSKCVKSGRLILEALKDPTYACPEGKFSSPD